MVVGQGGEGEREGERERERKREREREREREMLDTYLRYDHTALPQIFLFIDEHAVQ